MAIPNLTKQDFVSNQLVKWCPGCGDYVALSAMQRAFAELNLPKENIVMVSGIGCSSRFPYYVDTYGFHTIHGRATNFASGIKLANPKNQVWIVMGDGDAFSIGANHFIHFLRRNFNINVLILNNQIYGLTKGQYSPTSEKGKINKSTPLGSIEEPLNPAGLALSSKVSFYARGIDKDILGMKDLFIKAHKHHGSSVVEIYQNCNVFNDKTFSSYTDRETKKTSSIILQEGEPLVYGEENELGIVFEDFKLKSIEIQSKEDEARLLIHQPKKNNPFLPFLYAQMSEDPDLPTPFGIFKEEKKQVFEEQVLSRQTTKLDDNELENILAGKQAWEI